MTSRERHCLDHPGVPAVVQCAQCHHPLCEDCIAQSEGDADFCSVECLASWLRFYSRYRPAERRRFGLLSWLLWLAALAAVALGGLYAGRWLGIDLCKRLLQALGL